MPRIIIDGLDGTGKSTFAAKLAKEHNLKVEHEDKNTDYSIDAYIEKLKRSDYIMDRSFLSEMIYSTIFRRSCALDNIEVVKLLDVLAEYKVEVYLSFATIEEILKNLKDRGEVLDHNIIQATLGWGALIPELMKRGIIVFIKDTLAGGYEI